MLNPHELIFFPGGSRTGFLRFGLPLVLVSVLVLIIFSATAPDGQSAVSGSHWLDDAKPMASFLFTNEDMLNKMQSDLGLTAQQKDAVREAGKNEAAALADLKNKSDGIVDREDLTLNEKQTAIAEMSYNEQLRTIVSDSRTRIEAVLSESQKSALASWVDQNEREQRQQFVQTANAAAGGAAGSTGYRVYATQYYSNFGASSVDVAVPDKYVKFASLGWEYHDGYPAGPNYSVNLSYNGNQLNNVQVKDCGPWNIDDNYWNDAGGSRPRRLFSGLANGLPEAQAAFFDGYNGGKDQFGRAVSNPAGIDLSPQAGVQVGLGYLVSGWINVNFNWEAPGIPIIGGIRMKYDQLGGAPGGPRNAEYDVPGGRAQDFAYGRLIWNRASGQVFWVQGAILARYDELGGPGGSLGYPLTDEIGVAGGRATYFQGARLYWSAGTGTHFILGGILARYVQQGGPDVIGLPVTDEYDIPGGRAQNFPTSRICWSIWTDAHLITGAILVKFDQLGGLPAMGLPTTDEIDVPGKPGARMSDFQRGRIYWSAGTDSHLVVGAIRSKYFDTGEAAALGLPTSDETDVAGKPGARMNTFEYGNIYWSMQTGANNLVGAILWKYENMGGASSFGLPVSDEYGVAGGRASNLQVGRIYWSAATDAHHVFGGIMSKYDQLGGPGSLGFPTSDESDVPGKRGARMSAFQGGRIYWSMWTGANSVIGGILTKYDQLGGPASLGLPVTDESGVPGRPDARMNSFEVGRIYWSMPTGAHHVLGGIMAQYLMTGGAGGSFGLPVTDEFDIPGGRQSSFQGGHITWDSASGALRTYSN